MIALLERLKREYAESVAEVERYAPAVISVSPETMAAFLDALEFEHGTFDDLAYEPRSHRCRIGIARESPRKPVAALAGRPPTLSQQTDPSSANLFTRPFSRRAA